MNRFLKLAAVAIASSLLIACAHDIAVPAANPTNIYSDSDKKIPGKFSYSVDASTLYKFKASNALQGYVCAAHIYPIDGASAFATSIPTMLAQVFQKEVTNAPELKSDRTQLLFKIERFEPRMRVTQGLFSADANATVELAISVIGSRNNSRIFGTTVDTQRTKTGSAGPFCNDAGTVLADATKDAIKDVLEKIGERMANSQSLKSGFRK